MRISKDGVYADVSDEIAQPLIDTMGWSTSSRSAPTGARFVSSEELEAATIKAAQLAATGGKEVPPNIDWTAAVLAGSGTGLVEFRCINGTVQWRGILKVSVSNAGSNTGVRRIPAQHAAYNPTVAVNLPAYAIDTGTAYRIAMVRIGTDGAVGVAAPTGKFDAVEFDGLSYQVF